MQSEQQREDVDTMFPDDDMAKNGPKKQKNTRITDSAASYQQSPAESLIALYNDRQFNEMIKQGEALIDQFPDAVVLHNILGAANSRLNHLDKAIECYTRALKINPDFAEAHNNLGIVLKDLGRQKEAIECFAAALQINPDFAEAHNNRGISFKHLGQHERAAECYTAAIQSNPGYADAHNNLGAALENLGSLDEAIACYAKALECQPGHADAHHNLGAIAQQLRRPVEAIAHYDRALHSKPDDVEALASKLYQQAQICDWDGIAADSQVMSGLGISTNPVPPFALLALEDSPARHRIRSTRFAEKYAGQNLPQIHRLDVMPVRRRIGYFSSDFHIHPAMHLMAKLFEVHDRERFEVHAFSFGPDSNDTVRQRVTNAFDEFHDVRAFSDIQIAELARHKTIDIAVNLNGYTTNERSGIFACRAAPVQINYLGYPGTLGAPFIDYIIADSITIPVQYRQHYAENVIYLPHTYMATDNSHKISDRHITRSEMGLPDHGFVFCCFNNSYKITPDEFDIWMRLLKRVDGSVLWLPRSNNPAEKSLKQQAARRDVDPARLVFAHKVPLPEHLARHRLADLFLDTFNYNAHATASDALWAGLPLVTRPGRGFAARVAASLLSAIDLSELITSSSDEYEHLAFELATNPDRLAAVTARLDNNRNTTPLFDTELFARHVEDAYQQAYQRYFDGLGPADILVAR